MFEMERRVIATEKTRQHFDAKPFTWGQYDCIKMVRFHAVKMGCKGLPRMPRYSNLKGALRALKSQDCETPEDLLRQHFTEITPAMCWVGDIVMVPGDGMSAALICMGHKFMGYHPDYDGLAVMAPKETLTAFRI